LLAVETRQDTLFRLVKELLGQFQEKDWVVLRGDPVAFSHICKHIDQQLTSRISLGCTTIDDGDCRPPWPTIGGLSKPNEFLDHRLPYDIVQQSPSEDVESCQIRFVRPCQLPCGFSCYVNAWQLSTVCEVQLVCNSLRIVHRQSDGARLTLDPLLLERSLEEVRIAGEVVGVNEHLMLFLSHDKHHRFAFVELHDIRIRWCVRLRWLAHLGEVAEAAGRQARSDVAGEVESEVPVR
jgi:hypothetical protein